MFTRRSAVALLVSGAVASGTQVLAKGNKQHKHANGHNLLGGKLKQNGKHEVGKAGKETVTAEVSNGKVTNMSAGSLPVQKVKSTKKMAGLDGSTVQVAANGPVQLAQVEYYYAYGFDTGDDVYYYWYPASDVVVTDTWVEYYPA
jgi:hypothetical protein